MTAQVIHVPFRRDLSPENEARLEAATEWILAELDEPASITAMRKVAGKEFLRPRDGLHRDWAELFLKETREYA